MQELMPKILEPKNDRDLLWEDGTDLVFHIMNHPFLIFKRSSTVLRGDNNPAPTDEQVFNNKILVEQTRLIDNLSQLVIPRSKLFQVEANGTSYSFIAEEYLSFKNRENMQEKLYADYATSLEPAFHQLATLVAKTGWNGLNQRPPVVDDTLDFQGPRKIALLNFKVINQAEDAFTANGIHRKGLIPYLPSERAIDDAQAVAARHGIFDHPLHARSAQELKRNCLEKITIYQALRQFHAEFGLEEDPHKLLDVKKINTLGLDLTEQKTIEYFPNGSIDVTMEEVATHVIDKINETLAQKEQFRFGSHANSTKAVRRIRIDSTEEPFGYYFLESYTNVTFNLDSFLGTNSGTAKEGRLLARCLEALKEHRMIFDFEYHGQIIIIQA